MINSSASSLAETTYRNDDFRDAPSSSPPKPCIDDVGVIPFSTKDPVSLLQPSSGNLAIGWCPSPHRSNNQRRNPTSMPWKMAVEILSPSLNPAYRSAMITARTSPPLSPDSPSSSPPQTNFQQTDLCLTQRWRDSAKIPFSYRTEAFHCPFSCDERMEDFEVGFRLL
ncbi:hypothetical protein BC829DRAFT_38164 [Chytridium lagenaria]|nr:hypothetical protein BC829DRAFT_38164 [Chytridium lagenaria]